MDIELNPTNKSQVMTRYYLDLYIRKKRRLDLWLDICISRVGSYKPFLYSALYSEPPQAFESHSCY